MLGQNTTYLGISLTYGGPGVCEAVRETFHSREIMPVSSDTFSQFLVGDVHPLAGEAGANVGYTTHGDNLVTATMDAGNYLVDLAACTTGLRAIASG